MKKVLILGISGTFCRYVAEELQAQGWQLKAMLRDSKRLPTQFKGIEVIEGDASHEDDVRKATQGVSMLVYGISPANYDWADKALPWLDISARIVAEKKLTIVFPGNLYNFNPEQTAFITETSAQQPIRPKGEIRHHMELSLQKAANNGAKVLILRMGDFIAAQPLQSWLPNMLSEKKDKIILQAPGDVHLKHAWAYVPDAAKTLALLVNKLDRLPAFNVFHFKGYETSVAELAQMIEKSTGKKVTIKAYPWWFLQVLRPFILVIRGLFEMRYLWQYELLMDDKKLQNTIDEIPHTPMAKALVDSGYITAK